MKPKRVVWVVSVGDDLHAFDTRSDARFYKKHRNFDWPDEAEFVHGPYHYELKEKK